MISEFDIKTKDFSISLPMVIQKIEIVSDLIIEVSCGDKEPRLNAFATILEGAVEELKVINKAFYGK
jgi:hypothetical protein